MERGHLFPAPICITMAVTTATRFWLTNHIVSTTTTIIIWCRRNGTFPESGDQYGNTTNSTFTWTKIIMTARGTSRFGIETFIINISIMIITIIIIVTTIGTSGGMGSRATTAIAPTVAHSFQSGGSDGAGAVHNSFWDPRPETNGNSTTFAAARHSAR